MSCVEKLEQCEGGPSTDASAAPAVQLRRIEEGGLHGMLLALARQRRLLLIGPLFGGLLALGVAFLLPPVFTARTVLLPPQQQQSIASSALASLGALAGIAGASGGIRSPADQYVSLLESASVQDRIIDRFKLMEEYEAKFRVDARKELAGNARFSVGKKDGLIVIEVDHRVPAKAADIANAYVEELQHVANDLAITEAQRRRVFFEQQLKQTQEKLVKAQQAMQASGLSQGAIKAEPRAAAEDYARLKAEVAAAEVQLHALRGTLTDAAPEVQRQQATLFALRQQLASLERTTDVRGDPDYISRYRDFKYQETMFDLFARQYELARVDESREGTLIQVIDRATPPERKSKPKRLFMGVTGFAATAAILVLWILLRQYWQRVRALPASMNGSQTTEAAALRSGC